MGKKKKGSARLPQQWADAVEAEKTALRDRAQSTVKKQLSRRQRRAAAAGCGDSSPEREAPASAPPRQRLSGMRLRLGEEPSDPEQEKEGQASPAAQPAEGCGADSPAQTPRGLGAGKGVPLSGAAVPSPAAPLLRSSGKGWGLPLRYPSLDGSPLPSARGSGSLPTSARIRPSQGCEQREQLQQGTLGFAVLADVAEDAASAGEAEQASCSSSPLKPHSGAFVVLVGEGSADEVDKSEEEELGDEADLQDGCEASAADPALSSDAGLQPEQQGAAAEAASGDSFSFGGAAQQQGRSRFAFAVSPPAPAAAAAAAPSVLSPSQLQEGARLFGFTAAAGQPGRPPSPRSELPLGPRTSVVRLANLVPAGSVGNGSESDDETYHSAVPSRQPSAALTAYASARSLSRSGEDSPTRSSGATPLRCGEAFRAGAEGLPSAGSTKASVLEQLQQTAQLLCAAAQEEEEEEEAEEEKSVEAVAQVAADGEASEDGIVEVESRPADAAAESATDVAAPAAQVAAAAAAEVAAQASTVAPAGAAAPEAEEAADGGQAGRPTSPACAPQPAAQPPLQLRPSPFDGEPFCGASTPALPVPQSPMQRAVGRDASPQLPAAWTTAVAAAASHPGPAHTASIAPSLAAAAGEAQSPSAAARSLQLHGSAPQAPAAGSRGAAVAAAGVLAACPSPAVGAQSSQYSPDKGPTAEMAPAACSPPESLSSSQDLAVAAAASAGQEGLHAAAVQGEEKQDMPIGSCIAAQAACIEPAAVAQQAAMRDGEAGCPPRSLCSSAEAAVTGSAAEAPCLPQQQPAEEEAEAADGQGLQLGAAQSYAADPQVEEQAAPAAAASEAAADVHASVASSTEAAEDAEHRQQVAAAEEEATLRASIASSAASSTDVADEQQEGLEDAAADSFACPAVAEAVRGSSDPLRASTASSASSGEPALPAEVVGQDKEEQKQQQLAEPAGKAAAAAPAKPEEQEEDLTVDRMVTAEPGPAAAVEETGAEGATEAAARAAAASCRVASIDLAVLEDAVPPAPAAATVFVSPARLGALSSLASDSIVLHGSINTLPMADVTIAAAGIAPAAHASTAASPSLAALTAHAPVSPERGSPRQKGAQRRVRRVSRRSSLQIMSATVVHAFTPPASVEAAAVEAASVAAAEQPTVVLQSPVPRLGTTTAGLFGFVAGTGAAAAFSSPPATQPPEQAATPSRSETAAEGGMIDPASPAALEALVTARKPAESTAAEPVEVEQQQTELQQESELQQLPLAEVDEAGTPSAGQSVCSSDAEQEDDAADVEYEAVVDEDAEAVAVEAAGGEWAVQQEAEEQLLEQRQPSDSPLWQGSQRPDLAGPDAEAAGAAAAAEAETAASPQSAGQPAGQLAGSYSPGPLQGALLQHTGSGMSSSEAGELQALDRSTSRPFVLARSNLSGGVQDGTAEGVEEEEDDETASPGTEPLRYSLRQRGDQRVLHEEQPLTAAAVAGLVAAAALPRPAAHAVHSQHRVSGPAALVLRSGTAAEQPAEQERFPAPGAADAVFDSSLAAPAALERSHAAVPGSPVQEGVPGGGPAGGAAAWGAALTAGMGGSSQTAPTDTDGTGAGWQPYGLWKQQKERLLQSRGQVAHAGNGIPAMWGQEQGQPAESMAGQQPDSGRGRAAQQAGSPFTQHSSSARHERVPALPAGSLASAAEAAAVAASPMARSVRGMAADSPVQSPAHPMRPSALPPSAAALFAAAAAAEVASPQHLPAVAASPAKLSPDSIRFRQQFLPQAQAPAPGATADDEETGGLALSPGSKLQRRAAAAQAAAVEELEMQRLISEQQLLQRQAGHDPAGEPAQQQAALNALPGLRQRTSASHYAPQEQAQHVQASPTSTGASSMARYPPVQQQQPEAQPQQSEEERLAAALISARLAQAEQMSPLSSLQALRSSIALMAPPPALTAAGGGVAAAWTAQQQQIQGILARLEAQFREQRDQSQSEAAQRHQLEQQLYKVQRQVQDLQSAADDVDTLKLELLEARREIQQLQLHARTWQDEEEAAAEARRQALRAKQEAAAALEAERRQAAHAAALAAHAEQTAAAERRRADAKRFAAWQATQQQLQVEIEQREQQQRAEAQRVQDEQRRRRHALERERQERLRTEKEAELRRREAAQRKEAQRHAAAAAATRSAHPYDVAYHPSVKAQLAAQQQYYFGQPVEAVASQHQRQQQMAQQQQYATVRGVPSTRSATPERTQAAAGQRKGALLQPSLDPRSFAPLGAGAMGLQQGLHRQRSVGANAAAAGAAATAYDRRYTTIG